MTSLLKPMRLRFTHPDDVAAYGDRWLVYDEAAWTMLPARTLMKLEIEIGIPLVDVMTGVRQSSTFGDMAAAWLAMELDPQYVAPPFSEFNPIVMMIEWDRVPVDEESGKDEGPSLPASAPDPVPDGSASTATSPTDTVSLPNMPVSG